MNASLSAVGRRLLLSTAVLAFPALWCSAASALNAPAGTVILTVAGSLPETNANGTAEFDLALLQSLPQHAFSTKTPWYLQPRKFGGVLVRDLLDAVGAKPSSLHAIALNDYRVDIPVDDLVSHGAMVAYLLDDKPMSVRDKGPLVIIYPFDDQPEVRTALHYSRAVWQLRRLELR